MSNQPTPADVAAAEACVNDPNSRETLYDDSDRAHRAMNVEALAPIIARHIAAARAEGRAEGVKDERKRIAEKLLILALSQDDHAYHALRELAAELEKEPT